MLQHQLQQLGVNATIRRELKSTWRTLGVVAMQCGVAWLVALAVRLIGLALGLA